MKKIFCIIFTFFLSYSLTFSYNSKEWVDTINQVMKELENTKYSFKYNEWSSAKSSYHIFFEERMVWYIHATDNWISMWWWWQWNWEVWKFFTKTNYTKDDILKYFFKYENNIENVNTDIDNFIVKKDKLYYDEDLGKLIFYWEIDLKKTWNFISELSLKINPLDEDIEPFGRIIFFILDKEKTNEIISSDSIELFNDYDYLIESYNFSFYECRKWIEKQSIYYAECLWKTKIWSTESKKVNIKIENKFTNKIKNRLQELYKKIEKEEKWIDFIEKFDSKIKNLDKNKLEKISEKIGDISNKMKNDKYEDLFEYMLLRLLLEIGY